LPSESDCFGGRKYWSGLTYIFLVLLNFCLFFMVCLVAEEM